ncbi:MAG: phenylalanyl-tRNA synthetase beta chain [Acidobacteriaceae bacterium]|jgi:phenylalanyl-tRNA synthetase beta chain
MKLSPQWLRDFVDLKVNYHQLAEDLTLSGIAVESVSGEGESTVFEMEITTNRPDAMNHYGVARECSALYDFPLKPIAPALPKATGKSAFSIEIAEPSLCPRFTARVLRNVSVKPSPSNIAQRLALIDQRPINNAVDATNYTLWEMGKPTHVFDLDLLQGGKIVVRHARDGETLKTLDGVERKLTAKDLVVADAKKPVALAGVMGGWDTMITDKTRNIVIESAWWDPVTVRKMSKRHGIHTDASHRFERGADFEATILSCDRVAELILNSGGGELVGEIIDVMDRPLDQAPVALRVAEVHRILGEPLPVNEITRILKRLGFELISEPEREPEFTVRVPSWRLDVEREIDLIEEVARLHGYDKFSNTLPPYAGSVIERPHTAEDKKLRSSLLALGYDEAISLTFISHEDAEKFSPVPVLELENPLSEEASVMRPTLVPGMLNMLAYNLNRGGENVRLFEAGNVFERSGELAVQSAQICMGATGSAVLPDAHQKARPLSFFDLKGDVEQLLHAFQYKTLKFEGTTSDYYHPGRAARAVMDGALVAQFGQLHPEIAAARKLRQEVFIAEIYSEQIYKAGLREVRYQPLSRYPAVARDFSFIFSDEVNFETISHSISELKIPEMQSFVPVEVFRGGAIPAGKYSLLLRATFQSYERTLREEEVAGWSELIVNALQDLGGTQRA